MQLVNTFDAELGPLDAWPSYFLTIIFAFDPHRPGALARLQKVIAFFYGNNTPLNLACQFFAACRFLPRFLVRHHFQYLYDLFTQHPSLSRCRYYDLIAGCIKYTDGSGSEEPLPLALGFGGTGFPMLAQSILLQVNQLEYEKHAVY